MLEFLDYTYENLLHFAPYISKSPLLCSDVSLGAIFMWHDGLNMQFAEENDTFVVKMTLGDETAFCYPFGKDPEGMVEKLFEYVTEKKTSFLFYGISEEHLEKLKQNPRFTSIHANYDRRWSDYLYSFEEIRNLVGKKFSGQRNHINKFKKLYGEPDFRAITKADLPAIREMLAVYGESHGGEEMEDKELRETYHLLEHFEELSMYGGVLYVDGKVASFTIGEVVGDRLVIHVEKALTSYQGVYPTTFHSFVNHIYQLLGDSIHLINREDDAGDPGLRTSKTQYQPVRIFHKYVVNINSPLRNITEIPMLSFENGCLSAITEKDKAAYLALNIDKENNKYWGYDYEEDRYITSVDEDTFYDSQAYDHSIGASVNFAVRESEDGDLVGETIIYHFNYGNTAEIGGRIAKAFQGRGLGKSAFAKTAQFAKEVLKVQPVAKCFKENIPSYHMILAAGFEKTGEDEKFFYFRYIDETSE